MGSRSVVRRGRRALTVALGVLLAGMSAACVPGYDTFPGAEWSRTDPAAAGFDPTVLDAIAAEAQANASNCFAVVRHGQLVAEWYWNGTTATSSQEVF